MDDLHQPGNSAFDEALDEKLFAELLLRYPLEVIRELAHDPETVKKLLNYERPYPLSDAVFTKLFENMQTAPTAKALIDGVLEASGEDMGIADIIEMSTQYSLNGVTSESRAARLDLVVRTTAGETVNIEVQLRKYDYMPTRSRFYGGLLLSEALEKGMDFSLAPKLRIINLLDYNVRESHPDFVQPVEIVYRQPPYEVADTELTIYNVELPKFRAKYPDYESLKGDKFLTLLYMLDRGYADTREMEVLSKMSEAHNTLNEKYIRSINDPVFRKIYRSDMTANLEYQSQMHYAQLKGIAEGIAKGKAEGIAEGMNKGKAEGITEGVNIGTTAAYKKTIRRMLGNGQTVNTVYEYIDAPRSEIDRLIAEIRAESNVR